MECHIMILKFQEEKEKSFSFVTMKDVREEGKS